MAALQHTPISLQSTKSPPSARSPILIKTQRPIRGLSFSTTIPSLRLRIAVTNSRGGTRMSGTAAASYAVALADVAKANNTLETTNGDVEKIEKIFSDPSVTKFFVNPTIEVEKKRQVLEEIAASANLQPHTANFLNILVDSARIEIIDEIVKEFELVYNKITETELAVVSSVVQLESQHLAQIAKQVQKLTGAKNVRIKTVIDPSLVAGFTVRYGSGCSKLIDMSVKKQLEEITAQLDLGDIQLAV